MWRTIWAIAWKDFRIERHTGQTISAMGVFALAMVVTFNLALQGQRAVLSASAVGLLWATVLLTGTLGLNRSFSAEQENRSLDALLVSPSDRGAIYLGKVVSVTTFAALLELILVIVFTVFFNRPFYLPQVFGMLLLGTIGYVAAGVLVASMALQTRLQGVLLPVLLLPLTLPAVLAAASATASLLVAAQPNSQISWPQISFPIAIVIFYDVLMLAVGVLTYNYVVEE